MYIPFKLWHTQATQSMSMHLDSVFEHGKLISLNAKQEALKLSEDFTKPEDHWSCSSSESIHPQHSCIGNSKANCTVWSNFEVVRDFYVS